MDGQYSIDLVAEALNTVLLLAAPVLVTVLVVGLVTSVLQTLTQIQDPSLSQIPKLVAVVLILSATLPWMISRLIEYSQSVLGGIPDNLTGG